MSRERRVRAEAAVYLMGAKVALKMVPFRWLIRVFELEPRTPELEGPAREQARAEVRRAVHRVAHQLPGTFCFAKAIAAQAMLRRRAVSTTLYWGAAMVPGKGLAGHVWLQDGEIGIVGKRTGSGYTALASYEPAAEGERDEPRGAASRG